MAAVETMQADRGGVSDCLKDVVVLHGGSLTVRECPKPS